jgi:FkbM family methyltransferase
MSVNAAKYPHKGTMALQYHDREYSRKLQLVTWLSKKCNFTYTCRRGIARGLKRKGGLAFLPSFAAPSPEERFLWNLDLKGKVIFDIGGFVGLMTLLFASRGGRVFTFEPNPQALRRIKTNLEANHFESVTLIPKAVGDREGKINIVFDELMSGGASGDPEIAEALLSTSPRPRIIEAQMTTLDHEIKAGLPIPDFVKIDVEGMEYSVLQGMRQLIGVRKPSIYIELHGTTGHDKLLNARNVINALREMDYTILDVERGSHIPPDATITGKESHIFAA